MWKGEYPCVSTSAMRSCLCVSVCLCRLACITGLRGEEDEEEEEECITVRLTE